MRGFVRFIGGAAATTFWTGYFPLGPGTVGSIASSAVFYFCPAHIRFPLLPGILLLAWAGCEAGKRLWGKDPSRVTIDEFAGCWIACLAAPPGWGFWGVFTAFVLFRIFDIAKPWPVNALDRIESGLGILLDDVAAGIMAAAVIFTVGSLV